MRALTLSFPRILIGAVLSVSVAACATPPPASESPVWETIFDGETLERWTPKIVGQPAGSDETQIFSASDGVLRVSYDAYQEFDGTFGHLFFNEDLSNYQLKFEYQFTGEQVPGGPGWAFMNSGVMAHAQAPGSMRVDQPFPISIEAQLLGKNDTLPDRTSANICTPGTHVVIEGTLTTQHCINSQSPAFEAGTWVAFELHVEGGQLMELKLNGETAFVLTAPEYDPTDPDVMRLGLEGSVDRGYFALQAESHPVAFRNIQLMRLD